MIPKKLRLLIVKHFVQAKWYSIVAAILLYVLCSWILLWLAGEAELTQINDFFYWIMVTASTVGYGDLSPQTTLGHYTVGFFVIPVGLSLFALVLGKVAGFLSYHWRKGVNGLSAINNTGHLLVIGWTGSRTLSLLRLLSRELGEGDSKECDVVLCVSRDVENPMIDDVGFVKVTSFVQDDEMDRACIAQASKIIIDTPEDDVTMTTALYCNDRNPNAHIIAYFKDEGLSKLLQGHCPNMECTPSVAIEMLAKAAVDPGSSALHYELLSANHGMTQFSLIVPAMGKTLTVAKLFELFKQQYDATLIGILSAKTKKVHLNPELSFEAASGDRIFYIAQDRIQDINWNQFAL